MNRIDHVTLVVSDLDYAITEMRRRTSLFVSNKRTVEGTPIANAVVPFHRGYLELLSISPRRVRRTHHVLSELNAFVTARREGLYGFALNASKLSEFVARLRTNGSRLNPAIEESLEGDSWSTAELPPQRGSVFPYLIEYEQPTEENALRAASRQPFGMVGVEEVTVVVPKLDATLEGFDRDFGLRPARQLSTRAEIELKECKIVLIPAKFARLGTPLGLYSVTLGVRRMDEAEKFFRERDITLESDPFGREGTVTIDPAETFGSRIQLVQADG